MLPLLPVLIFQTLEPILAPDCAEAGAYFEPSADSIPSRVMDLAQSSSITFPPALPKWAPSRQLEFLAGRIAAKKVLECLGCDPKLAGQIGVQGNRAPIWPEGFVGSIAHTRDYACACAASDRDYASLGIDVERLVDDKTAHTIQERIQTAAEARRRKDTPLAPGAFLSVIFSAKESLYKALNPIVGCYFDFLDAELTRIDFAGGRLVLRLCRDLDPRFPTGAEFTVRFQIAGGRIRTALAIVRAGAC